MLTLYIIATLVGGVLVAVSAIGGHHGDVDHGGHDAHDIDHGWMPFLALRFWTYFVCFAGLTGLLLTGLTGLAAAMTGALAAGTGLISGLSISYAVHSLKRSQTSSAAGEQDLIGAEGKLRVAIGDGQPGSVRLSVKGELLDLTAVSAEGAPIPAGAAVSIIEIRGTTVAVIRTQPKEVSP